MNREVARRCHRRAIISFVLIFLISCVLIPLIAVTGSFVYVIVMGIGFGIVMLWENVSDHRDARRNG